jgi:hypothetical protein
MFYSHVCHSGGLLTHADSWRKKLLKTSSGYYFEVASDLQAGVQKESLII